MGAGTMSLWMLAFGASTLPPDVYLMRDRNLQIPIRVKDDRRADLTELVLYVSTDQGRTWNGAGKAKPTQDAFNFHATTDGLYWFSVQAVDRNGKFDPPDIAQGPPALKVMVDSQRPLVQIIAAERSGDEIQVSWQTQDSQADVNSLRLEYRPMDGSASIWQIAPVTPALNGQTRFRPNTNGPITIRLQMTDQAGTTATVVKDIPAAILQANSVAASTLVSPPHTPLAQMPASVGNVPPPMMEAPAPAAPQPAPIQPVNPPPVAPSPVAPPTAPAPASPTAPVPSSPFIAPNSTNDAPSLTPLPSTRVGEEPPKRPVTTTPEFGNPPPPAGRTGLPEVQHVRDLQIGLDFEIDRKGPSGIKKIETYITTDDGKTWFRYAETTETVSPLQVILPEKEAVYGFRIVVYSGVMQSEGPPKSGTLPDVRLHVDRTAPQVEWYPPVPDAAMPNALTLRFSIQDSNLALNSIVLQWSRQPDAGWQAIAPSNMRSNPVAGVPHLRECTWLLPPDIPDSVFLRVMARDQAGNVGERITRDPVTVDLNKPTARVKGVVKATNFRP